jgi:hypothetical protein
MKFAAISAATGHLQGRIIGFVGDRTPTREPTPILLSQSKTWEWVKETVSSDGPAMFKFYDNDTVTRRYAVERGWGRRRSK